MFQGRTGSPPHTRDKSSSEDKLSFNIRITPAYAGQILYCALRKTPCRDHPRIRGTNLGWNCRHEYYPGSSPHTRDKYGGGILNPERCGIIPAYAGQIRKSVVITSLIRDHPRIRGTNAVPASEPFIPLGSSPHTRDKYKNGAIPSNPSRIIPAYAGQILSRCFRRYPR